jgi:hypothetical protein
MRNELRIGALKVVKLDRYYAKFLRARGLNIVKFSWEPYYERLDREALPGRANVFDLADLGITFLRG